ncbi:Lipoprotein releasing system transmembrane protein LolC/LolE [hydrothermal vent metagenome]|uniref:Lipoprotein releasing system transmembrane protein LolC/LolE n=1 Tax=hydrothermal vent metagenome TaxID=652676 RepID=A0A3B1C3W2_9ZZZZ
MSFPFFVVNKYIRSNKFSFFLSFISVIAILGITIGVTVVIIALSVLDGFDSVISKKIVDFNSHILISGYGEKDLQDNRSIEDRIKIILNDDKSTISKYISKNSIIKSKARTEAILLYGINPDSTNLGIDKMIVKGSFNLENSDKLPGIVIGKRLAEKLLIKVDDKITVFSLKNNRLPSYSNQPAIAQFKVTGIYESGMPEYDDLKAYISLAKARSFMGMNSEISGYNIRLSDLSKLDFITEQLRNNLRYPYYVRTIFQQHQNIFTWIDLQKKPIPIVLGLIVLVAVFNIVGTILMNIVERTSQIGILKSLGASKTQLRKIFLIQGIYLGVIGIILGNLLAFGLSELQLTYNIIKLPATVYFLSSAPMEINVLNYLVVSVIAFVLTILSAIIPSIVASNLKPISAIRFD